MTGSRSSARASGVRGGTSTTRDDAFSSLAAIILMDRTRDNEWIADTRWSTAAQLGSGCTKTELDNAL